jgi:hypothetical protein
VLIIAVEDVSHIDSVERHLELMPRLNGTFEVSENFNDLEIEQALCLQGSQ